LGGEISFAHQNVSTYEFEQDCLGISHSFKRTIALMITSLCVKNFLKAEKPSTAEDISRELEVPIRLVRSVLSDLIEARLLSEVCSDHREDVAYQPACDIDRLTVSAVLEQLDQQGINALPVAESPGLNRLRETLKRFHDISEQSPVNVRLRDLQ
jgi:membrane protein